MKYSTPLKYHKNQIGYMLTHTIELIEQQYPEGGGIVTVTRIEQPWQLILDNNLDWRNAPFKDETWYGVVSAESNIRRMVINNESNTFTKTSGELYPPTVLDDLILNNFGKREIHNDIIYAVKDYNLEPTEYYNQSVDGLTLLRGILREMIYNLFTAKNENYKRIYEGITAEYNPLYNVDGTTEETHSGTDSTTQGGTDTTTHSGSDTTTHSGSDTTTDSNTDTVTYKTYPFDGNEVNREDTITDYGKTNTTEYGHTITDAHGEQVSLAHGQTTDIEHGETITTKRFGNIGVTKSTELIEDHLKIWSSIDTIFLNKVAEDIITMFTY